MSTTNGQRRRSRAITVGPERLEARTVLAAGIGFDENSRTIAIVGSSGSDAVEVRQQGANVVVSLRSAATGSGRIFPAAAVARISFTGLAGDDAFTNFVGIPSRADGGAGADVLRGGRGPDELLGGDGNDRLFGEGGNDLIRGGVGNDVVRGGLGDDELQGDDGIDRLWGGVGNGVVNGGRGGDAIIGGDGNDSLRGGGADDALSGGQGDDEISGGIGDDVLDAGAGDDRLNGDHFADGDTDGDGYDDDHDFMDILHESPGNPSAYADAAAVAVTIDDVTARVRAALGIAADDAGLRVRVQAARFGDRVAGVWRYLTPDKIQVWGRWAHPVGDPSRLQPFVEYRFTGPWSGNPADSTNPANSAISEQRRLYAGFLSAPVSFVSWLPGEPVGFSYVAPNEQATGYPAPIEQLRAALGSLPRFSAVGDSLSANLTVDAGFPGVKPILGVLRTIYRIDRAWYAEQRARRLPVV